MRTSSLLRPWVKVCLFLVSYFPLFVIIGILHYDNYNILTSVIVASLVGFIGLGITFYSLNHYSGEYKKQTQINHKSKVNFQYFLAYIIPFVAVDVDSQRQVIAYVVLLGFLCILYIRTELIYVNPTLTLLGYNLFKIKVENEEHIILITRSDDDEALKHPVVLIGKDLYYERRT